MNEPYYARCTVINMKMTKEQYDEIKYCESKMRFEKCSACAFSQRLQGLG